MDEYYLRGTFYLLEQNGNIVYNTYLFLLIGKYQKGLRF